MPDYTKSETLVEELAHAAHRLALGVCTLPNLDSHRKAGVEAVFLALRKLRHEEEKKVPSLIDPKVGYRIISNAEYNALCSPDPQPQPQVEGDAIDPANQACLDKRRPGEPLFIILGRDPDGGNIVRLWAKRRAEAGDCNHALPVLALANEFDVYAADPANAPKSAPSKDTYPALSPNLDAIAGLVEADLELMDAQWTLENRSQAATDCLAKADWRPTRSQLEGMRNAMTRALDGIGKARAVLANAKGADQL